MGRNRGKQMKTGKCKDFNHLRVAREGLANPSPSTLDAPADTGLGLSAGVGAGGVLAVGRAGVHLVDIVSGAAAADVVDGGGVLTEALLLGELLVEGEHGAFLLAMDVAGAAAARGEERVGGGSGQLDARGGA